MMNMIHLGESPSSPPVLDEMYSGWPPAASGRDAESRTQGSVGPNRPALTQGEVGTRPWLELHFASPDGSAAYCSQGAAQRRDRRESSPARGRRTAFSLPPSLPRSGIKVLRAPRALSLHLLGTGWREIYPHRGAVSATAQRARRDAAGALFELNRTGFPGGSKP